MSKPNLNISLDQKQPRFTPQRRNSLPTSVRHREPEGVKIIHVDSKGDSEDILSPFSRMALGGERKFAFISPQKPRSPVKSPRLDKSQAPSRLDNLEHLRPMDTMIRRRKSASRVSYLPNNPHPCKLLWMRSDLWNRVETRINEYTIKISWIYYYNTDDHRMELVHNTLTGFRSIIISGKVLLEQGGRSDEEWSCSCSATSRTTHKKFSCEIGLKPGTDEKKGVDYFFKIDGMLFEDAQTLYCETREGVQALRTFANLNELPRENPAWTVLATPRKLKLQDKLLTVVQSQGTTKYSGRWKTLTNWSLPLKDETVNVYLEHAANGKRKILVDGKTVVEKKQANTASRHELLLKGVECEVLIRLATSNANTDLRESFVYSLIVAGIDFHELRSFST